MELIVGQRDSAGSACASEADNVFRPNIGRKNRGPDNPPAEVTARQKIVGSGIFASLDYPPRHAQENAEVNCNHHPIDRGNLRLELRA
jgi:hypothetical protein